VTTFFSGVYGVFLFWKIGKNTLGTAFTGMYVTFPTLKVSIVPFLAGLIADVLFTFSGAL